MPHEEVRRLKALLIDTYRYHPNDVITLIDSDDPKQPWPTMVNIATHRDGKLGSDAYNGDHFFFHYSGHLIQKVHFDGSEEDGKDECLVPCDSDGEKNIIRDDDLQDILVNRIPQGSQLIAILDSCYSGSQLDLEHDTPSELLHVPGSVSHNVTTDTDTIVGHKNRRELKRLRKAIQRQEKTQRLPMETKTQKIALRALQTSNRSGPITSPSIQDLNCFGSYLAASKESSPGANNNIENSADIVNVKQDPELQGLSHSRGSIEFDAEALGIGDADRISSPSIQLPDVSPDPGHDPFDTLSTHFNVCCMQDYYSNDPMYLSIRKGEILQVVDKDSRIGWWRAVRQIGGIPGWIPQSHVQPLKIRIFRFKSTLVKLGHTFVKLESTIVELKPTTLKFESAVTSKLEFFVK
ncbi:caspase domain-containing protein [Rhodocollybia butyracea]|uniref:Caspase domain-containing protein n=1 Tax=Rhodocollybia butyracea TaxID=206335 RepID=A0A9P5P981_9AGAR|nr:caspase domain-containing protein [Rhodocollybia butyracea]